MSGVIRSLSRACLVAALVPALAAQAPPQPKTEAELDQQVVQALLGFARSAETYKSPSRAREAYRQILEHYDSEHAPSRTGLGWKKVKDEWQQVTADDRLPADAATPAQKKQVDDAWRIASKRVAALHETFGLALDAKGERARAVHHLERALVFAPDDPECHRALGHEEFDGFHGSAEQIEFVKRFRTILGKAREIAAQEVAVEPVDAALLPSELRKTGYEFAGARCKRATWWVVGTTEEAQACAVWNERGVLMLQYLLGDDPATNRHFNASPLKWVAVLRTQEQRAHLLEVSPVTRGGDPLERAIRYGGHVFTSSAGRAEWTWREANHDDHAVATATKRGTPPFNPGLSEGLVHTMTWLLCGTMHTTYMILPATAAAKDERSTRPSDWLRELRAGIDKGEDWPLVNVPREKMENFRDPVRFKAWSFVSWLLARHPDRWATLMVELGHEPRMPEAVNEIFAKVLGRSLGEVEAEWREWARAGSRIGKASGLPQ